MLFKICVIAALLSLASSSCDFPPRFWCDSKAIARECNVEIQCMEQMWVEESEVSPVKLDLYMESLCPDCINFITKTLYPTWKKFLGTKIMTLTAYPYGNAHEVQDATTGMWNFTCQHGEQECVGNLIECVVWECGFIGKTNCIQKYTNYDVMKYFPIFYCIESSDNPVKAAKQCATNAGLDWMTINKCATGPEGNMLMHKSALATEKLNPPHKYVPWVVLNGVHTEAIQQEAQDNLPKLLCDTYKGPKPAQCNNYDLKNKLRVSYRDE